MKRFHVSKVHKFKSHLPSKASNTDDSSKVVILLLIIHYLLLLQLYVGFLRVCFLF